MATIQKELIGRHTLVGDNLSVTDYVFSVPATPQGTSLPNGIDNQVIEEVYIAVDTSLGDVNVYLPSISSFNLAWNAKVYVCWVSGGNNLNIYPFNNEITGDTINGFTSIAASNLYDSWYLHIVQENMWMSLYCPGPIR